MTAKALAPAAAELEKKWKKNHDWKKREVPLNLRLRRAISWLQRAEQEHDTPDSAFIFYWIAFNALYADGNKNDEQSAIGDYSDKILALDANAMISRSIQQNRTGPIKKLLDNRYVYRPFWTPSYQPAAPSKWEIGFRKNNRVIYGALYRGNTKAILHGLFGRLLVLRNQILHGSATRKGSVNREQVRDGTAIMAILIPCFIDLMITGNPNDDWGLPPYPPAP